tara:strand:+ start:14017 stop:14709 length:693 start_codon:yes stop_codon:yes gene_type:complete
MKNLIRLDGIYSCETLDAARSMGLKSFQFDFRPRSLNFLQLHVFQEMINDIPDNQENFYLHFSNEKDFLIKKVVEDLNKVLEKSSSTSEMVLEFSDEKDAGFYDQFGVPFFWHYSPGIALDEVLKCYNLRGMVWSLDLLYDFDKSRSLELIFDQFWDNYGEHIQRMKLKNLIRGVRPLNFLERVLNMMPFDIISLPIDHHFESSYRNVDLRLLKAEIEIFDQAIEKELSL